MKTISIDFDGVIHKYSKGYHDGTAYDEPMPGAQKALEGLEAEGYELIIFSTRPAEQIHDWLEKYGFKKYKVFEKPMAIAYIDDRALRFTNWHDIKRYFL